ncbi:MAG: ATP-grasp domain-containing protein [Phycisphaerales bacterium]
MRLALVTCTELPRPDTDLPILERAFSDLGASVEVVPWEDAGVDWSRFDTVLVRSTWNYVGRLREFHAWLEQVSGSTRLMNPVAALRWNLHKRYLVELADAGLAVVPTEFVAAGTDADWKSMFARHGELVVKPAVSAGSFATIRVARGDFGSVHAHHLEHAERDLLVQPCLASVVAHGETNLVHFGGRFSHAIHKGARWNGDAEQSRGLVDPDDDERALAQDILRHVASLGFGELAYARVDLARGADGRPLLMELEILEPSLFLDRAPEQAGMLARAVLGLPLG